MTSKFNKTGQIIERIRNPSAFAIRAAIKPWTVHDDLKTKDKPTQKKPCLT